MRFTRRILWSTTGAVLTIAIAAAGAMIWHWTRPVIRVVVPQQGDWPRSPAQIKAMFGGEAGFNTIARPDRVEVYRILPAPWAPEKGETTIEYPIVAGPFRLPSERAGEVSAALASPKSYLWETVKGCLPEYGACLTFFRTDHRVDVLVCFECNVLLVAFDGTLSGGEDFDAIRPVLVRAAKAAFPADAVLQGLADQ